MLGDSLTTTSPDTPLIDPQPTQNSPVPTAPTPPAQSGGPSTSNVASIAAAPGHLIGHAFGKALSGLSGTSNEYSIDPNTGQTIATPVKTSPTDTFRSILALGLMGSQGIGQKSGDNTFAQGLLSGLGSGAKTAQGSRDQQDVQRRQQAQQEYANQLKAAEEQRENKKLTMDEQLNQVSIADHNQQMVARKILMDQQAYSIAKERGVDIAQPLIDNSHLSTAADKPMVDGYESLAIDPIVKNVPTDSPEVTDYLSKHPGATVNSVGLHTGTKTVLDPKTGELKVQDLISIYPPMTKVPPSLLSTLKEAGAENPKNSLHPALTSLAAKGDGQVNSRTVMDVYRQLRSWENLQNESSEWRVKQSEVSRNNATAYAESLRADSEKYDLDKKQDVDSAEKLFSTFYNPDTHKETPEASNYFSSTGVDPKTNKPWTLSQNQQHQKEAGLLKRYATGMYDIAQQRLSEHSKVEKDSQGNVTYVDTPAIAAETSQVAGFAKFVNGLQTGFRPSAGGTSAPSSPVAQAIVKRISSSGVDDPQEIQRSLASSGVSDEDQQQVWKALNLAPPSPLGSVPEGYTLVKNQKGTNLVPNETVDAFLTKHPEFQKVGQGQQKIAPEGPGLGTFTGEGGATLTR